MFKISSYKDFTTESKIGYNFAKKKKLDAACRAADMSQRNLKNQAKYDFYNEKK